jgi:carboxymethylenebutenolidase
LGQNITLTASDGHTFGGYRAEPQGTPKGAIVVIQEIFGVNHHIRAVCDRFAAEGFTALAPALFDRMERDFQTGYGPEDMGRARGMMAKPDFPAMLRDTDAAIKALQGNGPVFVVGFCMGGTIAYLAACQLGGLTAAVGYYGGGIAANLDKQPKVPVMLHFGELDPHIPMTDVQKIKDAKPEIELFTYNADHGFNCDERSSYSKESAAIAWRRTIDFIEKAAQKQRVPA